MLVIFLIGLRARSHGVSPSLLSAQADSLNVDIVFYQTTWETYESHFVGNSSLVIEMILPEVISFISVKSLNGYFMSPIHLTQNLTTQQKH